MTWHTVGPHGNPTVTLREPHGNLTVTPREPHGNLTVTPRELARAYKEVAESPWNGSHQCSYPGCTRTSVTRNMCVTHTRVWLERGPIPPGEWESMEDYQKHEWLELWEEARKIYMGELMDELEYMKAHGSGACREAIEKLREIQYNRNIKHPHI